MRGAKSLIKPYRMVVVGMTRTGKTFWVKEFLLPRIGWYVVYDPDMEFGPEHGLVVNNLKDFSKALSEGYDIIFQPRESILASPTKLVHEFEEITKLINAQHDLFYIIDEISNISLAGRRRALIPPQLQITIKRRMKHGIGLCITTQRLKDASADYITQCQVAVMFDMLPKDIEFVEENFPVRLPTVKKGNVKALALNRYHFFVYNHETRVLEKDVLIPQRRNGVGREVATSSRGEWWKALGQLGEI